MTADDIVLTTVVEHGKRQGEHVLVVTEPHLVRVSYRTIGDRVV